MGTKRIGKIWIQQGKLGYIMKLEINSNIALELFKKKEFRKIIDDFLAGFDNQPIYETGKKILDDHIKLLDITLRTCLMINDSMSFCKILEKFGHLSALSHFSAANSFFNSNPQEVWYFLSNASSYNNKHHGFWSLGLNSIPRHQNWFSYNQHDIKGKITTNLKGDSFANSAFVFSSNSGYFNKYFEYSYSTLCKTNENKIFVYHIINPDEETETLVAKYKNNKNINFNFEYTSEENKRKDYYASQRFYIAYEALNILNVPVFIFDIDTLFLKNTDHLFIDDKWSTDLLGIKISPNVELPWQKIAAGAIYIPNNNTGRDYLKRVCSFISMINKNTTHSNLWWIDQNALFFALTDMNLNQYQKWTGVLLNKFLSYPKILENKETFFKNNS